MKGCGYLLESAGHQRTPFRRLAARKWLDAAALPPSVTLAQWTPDVLDQNATGSCTGGATAAAIATALAAAGKPLGWVPSPRGIYTNGRAIDRVPMFDGTLPPLIDGGANANQIMRGITEWGVRPMRGPTSDGLNYDAEPSNVNNEPTLGELEEEATHLLIGEYDIADGGALRRDEICAAIAGKIPVTVAIAGGSPAFQAYTGGIMPALHSPLDHYVWIYGFQTAADGTRVFYMRNQWGRSWGENGSAVLSEAAVDELGDVIALDVSAKEAA